tara:strand:- start:197 stop:1012 length:816 start_codon:yes stop_codon:yes gene_type:complete
MKKHLLLFSLFISGVSLSQSNTIVNGDFENWTTTSTTEADNWNSFNSLMVSVGAPQNLIKTTDAYNGTYAAQLITDSTLAGIIPGLIGNGLDLGEGVAFSGSPTNFTGAYKYTNALNDTASIYIEFTENGNTVGVQFLQETGNVNTYTTFNLPITLLGQPDTMIIICSSGNQIGSTLYVDNFQLTSGNVDIVENTIPTIKIYPNPANTTINLISNTSAKKAKIIGLDGKVVSSHSITGFKSSIDVSTLIKGVYWVEIETANEVIKERFIKL